jgi:hypothetical protein
VIRKGMTVRRDDMRMIDRLEAQPRMPGYCARVTERGWSWGRRVARSSWHVALAM